MNGQNRSLKLELGIVAFLGILCLRSAQEFVREVRGPSGTSAGNSSASRDPASHSATFEEWYLRCGKLQQNVQTSSSRIRIVGTLCDQKLVKGELAPRIKKCSAKNMETGYDITTYCNPAESPFSTEYAPLERDNNPIELTFEYETGKKVRYQILVSRKQPTSIKQNE